MPQPSAISHQPSAISHQPSAISHQPSAISHQPSAISHQPSAISHQPSAISHQPSAISHQPSAISPAPGLLGDVRNYELLHFFELVGYVLRCLHFVKKGAILPLLELCGFFYFLINSVQPIIVKFAIFSDLVDKKKFYPGKGRSSTVQGWWFPFLSPLHNYFSHALVFVKLRERHPAIL